MKTGYKRVPGLRRMTAVFARQQRIQRSAHCESWALGLVDFFEGTTIYTNVCYNESKIYETCEA